MTDTFHTSNARHEFDSRPGPMSDPDDAATIQSMEGHRNPGPVAIERVDIRDVWKKEDRDFTPWLADNLDQLASQLGLGELEAEDTEVPIPGGRALDIKAEDDDGGVWAIENQFGQGDHDHLTRALAYGVALECRGVVVVAEGHREEFVAVADEWNRYSDAFGPDGIKLFLVTVEAWRIADSPVGYRFRLDSGPNEWVRSTRIAGPKSEAVVQKRKEQQAFWARFLELWPDDESNLYRGRTPRGGPYLSTSHGSFAWQVWVKKDACHVQLRIESGDQVENKAIFDEIESQKERVEAEFGHPLIWNRADNASSSVIRYDVPGGSGTSQDGPELDEGISETIRSIIRLHNTVEPAVESLA